MIAPHARLDLRFGSGADAFGFGTGDREFQIDHRCKFFGPIGDVDNSNARRGRRERVVVVLHNRWNLRLDRHRTADLGDKEFTLEEYGGRRAPETFVKNTVFKYVQVSHKDEPHLSTLSCATYARQAFQLRKNGSLVCRIGALREVRRANDQVTNTEQSHASEDGRPELSRTVRPCLYHVSTAEHAANP